MDLLSDLRNILPEEESVRADGGEVERHGDGMFTYHDPRPPDAVVYPRNRDEVESLCMSVTDCSGEGGAWRMRQDSAVENATA